MPVCHTHDGVLTACRRRLSASDRQVSDDWAEVTCPACLEPQNQSLARLRAEADTWTVPLVRGVRVAVSRVLSQPPTRPLGRPRPS